MTRRMQLDDLTRLAVPSQPALSPDGSQVAYVLRTLDADRDRSHDELWVVPAAGGTARRLTAGPQDTSPAWSPDGSQLAFLRAGQLHVLAHDGGEPRRVTDLPRGAGAPSWSPDGSRLAFAAPVDPTDGTGPLVARRLDYQTDGVGMFGSVRNQLHVVDLASAACRQVTDGPDHAGQPAWLPDGSTVAFVRRVGDDSDLTLRSAVHLLDVDDAKGRPRQVGSAGGVAGTVVLDADGEHLLVVGHPGDPVGHQHLQRVPLAGGEAVSLTAHLDRNVMPGAAAYPGGRPQRDGDGRLLFCIRDRGCTHLWAIDDTSAPEARPLLAGEDRVVSGLSVVGTTAVVALTTATSYGEIVALDLTTGTESVLTDHGASVADVELFRHESRTFTISDGTEVQGWLLRDPERQGPRPLLLDVHGGPHNAWNGAADEMHFYHQELVSRGWAVLLVNPRGSDGYGEAFFDGVNGAWGVADADDFLEPLDDLVAEGVADPDRLAVTGYSYGGFMTAWLTGHDQRFKAGVAGGIVSDMVSMYGTADDGVCLSAYELGGAPWDEPERYAAMSPLTTVTDVTTPTLVLHGLADLTCPVGQAQQWHSALRSRGVPTELVLYPDASHVFILAGPPSQRIDYGRRLVDWVEQHTLRDGRATIDAAHWERRLSQLAERYGIPGAQLGILRLGADAAHDEVVVASHGLLNIDTGAPVTEDAVFQIGSISKVWTATVVMQLIDEGRATLDTPVVEIVPDLRLADPETTKKVTLRHLLTHTSGIDGDVFTDTGRGDDCLEKYVGLLGDEAQIHPLGVTWSYCNSGFSVLGLVIERLTGMTWDAALRERLFEPLQMQHALTLPEEALLQAAAVGHVTVDGRKQVAPVWQLPRSIGPAGLVTANAADVLSFARMHLAGGAGPDGTRVLSEASAADMAAFQTELPDKHSLGDSWGLGWIRFGWDGQRVYGHDGNTIGQAAFLRVLPEAGVAVTLLTNNDGGRDLYEALYREILAELAGVEMPSTIAPPEPAVDVDITPFVGRYERSSVLMEVLVADGEPRLRTTVVGPLAEMVADPVDEHALVPYSSNIFLTKPPEAENWSPVTFFELPTGERYLHFGVRATPRVD
jgi:dipeptidyl aminopeptidase/acylaminoacyl peptidase